MIRWEKAPEPYRLAMSLAMAVALCAAALGVTLLLQTMVSTAGYIFFYAAILASSWFCGGWAGGLATVLSTLAVAYFFVPPIHSFRIEPAALPVFIEFAASSAIVSWFSSWRKGAEAALKHARDNLQTTVEQRTAALRQTNERLMDEIAERRRAEDAYYAARIELARVTRMTTLGALAASISHEVNQPLAAVVTNADACAMWLASDPPNLDEVRLAVDNIAREGTRASDIVRRIRAMFTKGAPDRAELQMNDLIREAVALLSAEVSRSGVEVTIESAPDLPPVTGDRVQLQQVLVNLLLNGIEAMNGVSGRARVLNVRSATDDGAVLVAVRDAGKGIDPANLKRIFDAFFTTKAQGMGMGLAISHAIIESHGGQLWATANPDHGVTLQFRLPAALRPSMDSAR